MSTISSQRLVVAAAMVVTTWMTPVPAHAQTTGTMLARNAMPLTASVHAAALEHSRFLTETPASPPKRRSCGKGVVMGLAIGAGAGLAVGGGALAATGGSDAFYQVLFNFTQLGTVIGGLIFAAASCSK
jgi:hypothetical protein